MQTSASTSRSERPADAEQGALESSPWHVRTGDEVLGALNSSHDGLSQAEAESRLADHGPNALTPPPRRHPLARFFAQLHSALIDALLAAAAAAALMGHRLDAAVIVAVVLVNAIVGFLQEGKAESALASIQRLISPRAHVLRDGSRLSVPGADLIPGDVVLLEAGDRVPADLRLLRARGLLIDEALLTGESLAAQKQDPPAAENAAFDDRRCTAFSGTMVAA